MGKSDDCPDARDSDLELDIQNIKLDGGRCGSILGFDDEMMESIVGRLCDHILKLYERLEVAESMAVDTQRKLDTLERRVNGYGEDDE